MSTVAAPYIQPAQARLWAGMALALFALALFIFVTQRPGWWGLHSPPAWGQWLHTWPAVLRGSWPSFAHSYAVVVLGCLWLARSARQALGIGLLLGAVDLGMELLQARPLHATLNTPHLARTWLGSTFDFNDLAAIGLGLAAASATLVWARHQTLKGKP